MRDRVDNDAFFRGGPPALEETRADEARDDPFFAHAERPPPPQSVLVALGQSPVKFGLVLFVLGWMGILVQRGFFSQIVAGAPLFEEPAKVGAILALVGLLRIRPMLLRVPLAALAGAGFGVFEHVVTYAEEDVAGYALRVAFHAISTATSMAAFSALEPDADVRLRWAATLPATLLHYANNFGALVFAFAALLVPAIEVVAMAWSVTATVLLGVAMMLIVSRRLPIFARQKGILLPCFQCDFTAILCP